MTENKDFIQFKPIELFSDCGLIFYFDTQTFGLVYLSNINNQFLIKTGYRYAERKLKALLFPGPGVARVTNYWCITDTMFDLSIYISSLLSQN